ncbi:hypothetical protein NU219Hw_g7826t1 [Hortaea werneckii]
MLGSIKGKARKLEALRDPHCYGCSEEGTEIVWKSGKHVSNIANNPWPDLVNSPIVCHNCSSYYKTFMRRGKRREGKKDLTPVEILESRRVAVARGGMTEKEYQITKVQQGLCYARHPDGHIPSGLHKSWCKWIVGDDKLAYICKGCDGSVRKRTDPGDARSRIEELRAKFEQDPKWNKVHVRSVIPLEIIHHNKHPFLRTFLEYNTSTTSLPAESVVTWMLPSDARVAANSSLASGADAPYSLTNSSSPGSPTGSGSASFPTATGDSSDGTCVASTATTSSSSSSSGTNIPVPNTDQIIITAGPGPTGASGGSDEGVCPPAPQATVTVSGPYGGDHDGQGQGHGSEEQAGDPYEHGQGPNEHGQGPYEQGGDPYGHGQGPYEQGGDHGGYGHGPHEQAGDHAGHGPGPRKHGGHGRHGGHRHGWGGHGPPHH